MKNDFQEGQSNKFDFKKIQNLQFTIKEAYFFIIIF